MTTFCWYEHYKTAVLETDAMKIREQIQTAEAKIQDRERVLAEDHGGTPEERRAIADAINGLKALLNESAEWPRLPNGGPPTSD